MKYISLPRKSRRISGSVALIAGCDFGAGAECALAVLAVVVISAYLTLQDSNFLLSVEHYFSNCPCIAQHKQGEESINRFRPVGLKENELFGLLGSPNWTKEIEDDEDRDHIWVYSKLSLLLYIKDHRCSAAYPNISVLH